MHPLQEAFVAEQAPQCGYCYNGMTIKGAELLAGNPSPSDTDIREAMSGHLPLWDLSTHYCGDPAGCG